MAEEPSRLHRLWDLLYGYIVKLGAAAPHAHTSLDLFINLRLGDPKPHPSFSSFFILKSRVGVVCHYRLCAWKRFSVFCFLFYILYLMLWFISFGKNPRVEYNNPPEKVSDDTV